MAGYRLSLQVGGGTLSRFERVRKVKMPRYLVHGIVKIDVQSEIEADSKAEAMLIASEMSGSDFDEEGLTDGEEIFISTAQLIEEDTNEI